MEHSLFLKKINFFFQNHQIDSKTPFLLAISGGVDSVVLGHSLVELGYEVAFAHVNHGLRGEESEGDALFVRNLAARLGCTYFEHRLEYLSHSNLQENARNARYEWLFKLAAQLGRKLMTAHNQDDQLETILMHLGRGTGVRGMMGMQPINDLGVLHPLLQHSKQEILDWAKEHNLIWREDTSNSTGKYLRNRVRQQLIPVAKALFPAFEDVMQRNTQNFKAAQSFISQQIADMKLTMPYGTEGFKIDATKLKKSASPDFILGELLNYREMSQIEKILSATVGSVFSLGEGRALHVERDSWIVLQVNSEATVNDILIEKLPFTGVFLGKTIKLSFLSKSEITRFENGKCYFDWDALKDQMPLIISKWQNGQRMSPLGLKGKSKKISDLLTDWKYPSHSKANAWVISTATGVVISVENLVSCYEYRIGEGTELVLVLEILDNK